MLSFGAFLCQKQTCTGYCRGNRNFIHSSYTRYAFGRLWYSKDQQEARFTFPILSHSMLAASFYFT